MNNVRCAGYPLYGGSDLHVVGIQTCGWKGERLAYAPRWRYWGTVNQHSEDHPEFVAKVTAKPCPRCGGRVELIPAEVQP